MDLRSKSSSSVGGFGTSLHGQVHGVPGYCFLCQVKDMKLLVLSIQ